MADSIPLPRLQPLRPYEHLLRLAPGVLLLALIGYAGKLLEKTITVYTRTHHLVVPQIEYVLWAILIGLVSTWGISTGSCFWKMQDFMQSLQMR